MVNCCVLKICGLRDVGYIVPQGNHNNVSCGIVDEYDVGYIVPQGNHNQLGNVMPGAFDVSYIIP